MTLQNLINTYFQNLESEDSRPLHAILQDRLQRLIDNLPDHSVFPSERSLSEALNVHRNTLHKAMEPFLAQGLLVRSKRQTLVSHEHGSADAIPQDTSGLHPLQLQALATSNSMPTRPKTITLRLYETLPKQQQFWQETIAAFQCKYPACNINLQVTRCANFEDYRENLQEDAPDLFQLPVPFTSFQQTFSDLLAPLPDDLFPAPEYLTELYEQEPRLLQVCCPLSFAIWHHQVNMDLAQAYHLDLTDFNKGGLLTKYISSGLNLPPDLKLSVHIDSIVTAMGLPKVLTRHSVHAHSLRLFRILSSLKRHHLISQFALVPTDQFLWFQPDVLKSFVDGKMACHTGTLPLLLEQFPQYRDMHIKSFVMFPPDTSCMLNVAAVAMGISSRSPQQETCVHFLRHLLSEEEQERMLRLTSNLPFNRTVALNAPMLQGYEVTPQEIIGRYGIVSSHIMETYWSGKLGHCLWFDRILNGTCTPEEAADQFTDAFVQAFFAQMTANS